jgi:hypothetical protein
MANYGTRSITGHLLLRSPIYELALGPEHPDVALNLNSQAALYRAQGQLAKAEPLIQRALAILENLERALSQWPFITGISGFCPSRIVQRFKKSPATNGNGCCRLSVESCA